MFRPKFKRTLVNIALTLLTFAPIVIEGTFESIKAAGMGGTVMAHGQDSLSAAINPALATEVGQRWDIGVSFRQWNKSLTIDPPRPVPELQTGTFRPSRRLDPFPALGINLALDDCLIFSISGYVYKEIDTRYNTQLTDFSGVSISGAPLGNNARITWCVDTVTTALAYQINDYHSLGIGLNWNFGHFLASGFNRMPGGVFTIAPGSVTNNGYDDAFGVGATIGWVGHFCDGVTAGLSYTPQTNMSRFHKYKGLLAEGRIDLPETMRGGIAYDSGNCWTVALDGEWRRYGRVNSLANPFPGDTDDPFAFIGLFGNANGPGFGWKDEWVLKTGVEYAFTPCLIGRLGYRHEWNPLRNQTTNTAMDVFIVETVTDYITGGFTYLYEDFEASFFAECGSKRTRHSYYPEINPLDFDFDSANLIYKSRNYAFGLSLGKPF